MEIDLNSAHAERFQKEASRLRQRVTELEELGQDHDRKLQMKITELEEQEQRLQEEMSHEEEAISPNPPAMRELTALQAERRALVAEKAELEQTLAERHARLNHTEELVQRLQEEKLEAESRLAKLQKEEDTCFKLTGHTDANQTELERLRSENAALGAQCRGLAELAENACKRALEARMRFEQAESAVRRRDAECNASSFVEATSEPFEAVTFAVPAAVKSQIRDPTFPEAGSFGDPGAVNPQIQGPTFPEGPRGICVSTPGTLAPDVALNASLPSEDDHTLTVAESATHSLGNLIHHSFAPVHWSPEQSTAEFGLPSARAPCMSTSPVVHLRANVASPQATFTPLPQSGRCTVRSAGLLVQPAGGMSMQTLAPNTPCGLAVVGASHIGAVR